MPDILDETSLATQIPHYHIQSGHLSRTAIEKKKKNSYGWQISSLLILRLSPELKGKANGRNIE